MKKALLLLLTILPLRLSAQDSLSAFGQKLEEYTAALEGEGIGTRKSECDFLISTCQVPEVRQYAALWLYDHYLRSRLLGDNDVAVHIASEWFP